MATQAPTVIDTRLVQILKSQLKKFYTNPDPYLLCICDETDIRIWYFLIVGLGDPFLHGEFIFKLTALDTFPHTPPKFEIYTENGVFNPGGAICISIGEFHSQNWRPALGMTGFAIQVYNCLICFQSLGAGIRICKSSDEEKKFLALKSRIQNQVKFKELVQKFDEIIAENPKIEPVLNLIKAREILLASIKK